MGKMVRKRKHVYHHFYFLNWQRREKALIGLGGSILFYSIPSQLNHRWIESIWHNASFIFMYKLQSCIFVSTLKTFII